MRNFREVGSGAFSRRCELRKGRGRRLGSILWAGENTWRQLRSGNLSTNTLIPTERKE